MSDVEQVLARVAARRPKLIDLSLDRVHAVLARLGDPHKKLPPVIHVAGTNGKGSTIAYIRSMLKAAGKSVHVYTSPHLVRFNERIVLAGEEIKDDVLIDALERCDDAAGEDKLTYFETTTCAAFLAFSESPADYLLLEVGLGGRLDATNVIEAPLATAVTPVAMDHEQFLGDTIQLVASEKAGIFRRTAPAVIGVQSPEAMAILCSAAAAVRAKPFVCGQEWNFYSEHGRLVYQDENGLSDLEAPRLVGGHQLQNAALAVAVLKAADINIDDEALSKGLVSAAWPARLQRLTQGPLIDLARAQFSEGAEFWLDGGHNPHAGEALARALADIEAKSPKPLIMISGMQDNKDATGYFAAFAGFASKVYAVAADHEAAATAEATAAAAKCAGFDAEAYASVKEAVQTMLANAKEPPRVLLSGSLYLAGEILRDHV